MFFLRLLRVPSLAKGPVHISDSGSRDSSCADLRGKDCFLPYYGALDNVCLPTHKRRSNGDRLGSNTTRRRIQRLSVVESLSCHFVNNTMNINAQPRLLMALVPALVWHVGGGSLRSVRLEHAILSHSDCEGCGLLGSFGAHSWW